MEITMMHWINLAGWAFVAMCGAYLCLEWAHGRRSFRDDMDAAVKRWRDIS